MAERPITRRSLLKWSVAAGAAGLVGLKAADAIPALADETQEPAGEWKTGACYNNCNCGVARCLLRVYMEDGVPVKIRSDEDEVDTYAVPQRRACARGRARMSEQVGPARIKYPMKRKNWSPEDPHPELRGRDEWERISWDEALGYVADGVQKTLDEYGPKSILCAAVSLASDAYYDNVVRVIRAASGGSVHLEAGTVSFGSWAVADNHMIGGFLYGATHGVHHNELLQSELHVMFGCNWAANKAGNHPFWLEQCHERGAKVIAIDPWLSQTAAAVADEWVPVLPGSDTALVQAICHEWIVNGTYDQAYLDKYCVGFDASTLPEGEPEDGSWKDYIMGTSCYDAVEKTPEWAEAICGVPAGRIRELAATIASCDKVNFHAAQSSSKLPAGEQFVQSFYTMALMHGGIGTPGHYMSWVGLTDAMSGSFAIGNATPMDVELPNAMQPVGAPVYMDYPIPRWDLLEDPHGWLDFEPSECWRSILAGEYGRDCWPGGKIPVDIHQIYFGGSMNSLNQLPDANDGIKAVRSMDFVWGMNPFFDASRQYCDVVLPCTAMWEKSNKMAPLCDASIAIWWDKLLEPLYEAKNESWIAESLAEKMGIDPKVVNPLNDDERRWIAVRDATVTDAATFEAAPLLTVTQEEIDELFPEAADAVPQEGAYNFSDLRATGILKYPLEEDTPHVEPFSAFYADPEANPLATESGKFEIYSRTLAASINSVGYSTIYPVGVYQVGDPEQGAGQQTDEFPLLLWSPHSLRRAHSPNENVVSLREAFPQECFMSTVDAEARGIKNGDTVLMSSPYGQVLRHAKVVPYIVPGAVALQDGAWIQIDEETGIDLGGNPNILQAPKSSGGGCQAWSGTLLQVEKYEGPLTLDPDKDRPIVTPVGIDA